MARPHKDGVDYFPLDTDFFYDRKVKLIRSQFGSKGVYVALAILAEVYRTGGYYKKWDEDDCLLMSQDVAGDCSPRLITDVLNACLRRQLFDKGIFEMWGVITSEGIQKRFLRMVANSRGVIPVISEYWLLNGDDALDVPPSVLDKLAFRSVSGSKTPVTVKDNPEKLKDNSLKKRKENKSKANESRGEDMPAGNAPGNTDADMTVPGKAFPDVTGDPVPYDDIAGMFNSVCVSLPKVCSMPEERKKNISARYGELGGSCEELKRFFERVEASDFLTGRRAGGDRSWKASFDWIMKQANFLKIREGNYDNVTVHRSRYDEYTPADNGRYAPTYDLSEIQEMLDAEWFGSGT